MTSKNTIHNEMLKNDKVNPAWKLQYQSQYNFAQNTINLETSVLLFHRNMFQMKGNVPLFEAGEYFVYYFIISLYFLYHFIISLYFMYHFIISLYFVYHFIPSHPHTVERNIHDGRKVIMK